MKFKSYSLLILLLNTLFSYSQTTKKVTTNKITPKSVQPLKPIVQIESFETKVLKKRGMLALENYNNLATNYQFTVGLNESKNVSIKGVCKFSTLNQHLLLIKLKISTEGTIHCPGEKLAFKILDKNNFRVLQLYSTNGFACSTGFGVDSIIERMVILSFEIGNTDVTSFDLVERDTINNGSLWNFRNISITDIENKIALKDFFGDILVNVFAIKNYQNEKDEYQYAYDDDITGGVFFLPYKVLDGSSAYDVINWTGEFENGLAEGRGRILFGIKTTEEIGFAYLEGYMIEGKLNGGAEYWQYINKDWVANKATNLKFDKGVLVHAKIQIGINFSFEGETKGIWPDGQGKWTKTDGSWYEGAFKDGEENGEGVLRTPDGLRRYGNFKDGVPHGKFKIKQWTLMGLSSNEWDAEYNMGQPVGVTQIKDDFDRLLSGRNSGVSSSSNSKNKVEEKSNKSSDTEQQIKLVEIKIERNGKACCTYISESYCFLIYEDGKQNGNEKTIHRTKNGDWYTDCDGVVSGWKVCGSASYSEALKSYYRKKYNTEPQQFKITD